METPAKYGNGNVPALYSKYLSRTKRRSKLPVNTIRSRAAVLLVAHGTRDASGVAEVRTLAERVSETLAPRPVETGFLELIEPTIGGACDRLVERGAKQIQLVPLLLFAAGHAKADLPQAVCQLAHRHKEVEITVATPFGQDDRILALSRRRFDEAIAVRPRCGLDETYWLVVGRGSSDAEATAEFGRFARRQARRLEVTHFGCSFVAAAQPTLEAGLKRAAQSAHTGVKRIVVQPHLLFRGAILDQIYGATARSQAQWPAIDWVTCAHLGPEQELVEAIVQRASD